MKLLHIGLVITFWVALWPASNHVLTMREMHMLAGVSSGKTAQEKTGDNPTASCCEAIGSLLLACDFMIFQSGCADPSGDSEEILQSIPIFQSLYIQSLGPPPKA